MSEPSRPVRFDPEAEAYLSCRVARGFPLGGIGTGGVCFNADGSFGELRSNNNWMCPVRGLRGSFHALFVRAGGAAETALLRLPWAADAADSPAREYEGVRNVAETAFVGRLPAFALSYGGLPLAVRLDGFTPLVPHDVRDSTMPGAVFRFTVSNPLASAAEVALLFSFENPLGRGGTGHLGVELGPERELRSVKQRVVYDSSDDAFQEPVDIGGRRGVRFRTRERWPDGSHRRSVTGEYLLLAEAPPGSEVTVCDGWDASGPRCPVVDDFARDGRIASVPAATPRARPAAAVAVRARLEPGATCDVAFALAWWTADHVTEPALAKPGGGSHDGIRVGHVYENHFAGLDAVASELLDRREDLAARSLELARLLDGSTLPRWLVRALLNSADSVLANTVVPLSGRLYTLEGVDWHWPMGGLTGTNDQRLSAHPYLSVFFAELDLSELDEFRRLHDARGAIPHGNGNCDLALGSTDVPYGWPMFIRDFLPAKEWTDLSMSLVLQVAKHWRTSGSRTLLERFWEDLVRAVEYLDSIAPRGVPEGGTTYDVWDFPGVFSYTATLWAATLAAMADLAAAADPARVAHYDRRRAIAEARIAELWDERGFYRSTSDRDTLFTAALAGDWIARYAGLEPVVPPARARSHLRHQHRVLFELARGDGVRPRLPLSEARFDGEEVAHPFQRGMPAGEVMTYVWQVISYQACEQIYVGLVDEGLSVIRSIVDRVWSDGNAWSAGLRGDGESIYMTHPVFWAVPNALTGAALDVPRATLVIGPRAGADVPRLRCPFFFPGFWAMLDHEAERGRTSIEVVRSFGVPVVVERVRERRADGSAVDHRVPATAMRPGARLEIGG
ncbi:MAG TPA: GH116 family glycosyl-hydrolase [Candidatus Binatia bacterium]|nr:GH116 family glycosyl-hydrolase [Candidatus Binatia bacterium]